MENMFTKMVILTARFIVIGFYTLVYVLPLYLLFYLIIFQNTKLSIEISTKFFIISYLIGFVIQYINIVYNCEKYEIPINKRN